MMFESSTTVLATVAVALASLYVVYSKLTSLPDVPSQLPWTGLKNGLFSRYRARISTLSAMLEMIEDGYRKYSKNGLNFVLPGITRSQVILPPSQVKWITDQPESVLNSTEAQREELQTDYTLLDRAVAESPVHYHLIKGNLSKEMDTLIPEVIDEIEASIGDYWGHDTKSWSEVVIFETMMKTVSRATNRVFVGLPLCRNEEYLVNAAKFAGDVAMSGTFIRVLPGFLKPLLGWIFVLPNRWHAYKCTKHLIPLVGIRMESMRHTAEKTPVDFTTWNLQEAEKSADPEERTPRRQAMRLMVLNFAAIHTSTFTATQILFDLFSSPQVVEYVKEIREEIQQVLSASDGKWSKAALSKMVKLDSAVRESLRISTFMSHGMDRLVIDPKGVTTENGLFLRYGTRVGTSTSSIHHDDEVYENSMTYEAFRFCQADSKDNAAIVTTSDKFLAFGHGRHACPGRFFAAVEMKLLTAYILMNYDIRALDERPKNWVISGTILPSMKATLSIRRRVS